MSIIALEWAWQQECATPSQKLVLVALAHHHNGKTGACFPSSARLSECCNLHSATVFRTIKILEKQGLVVIDRSHGKSNHYTLPIPNDLSQDAIPPIAECDTTYRRMREDLSQDAIQTGSNRKEQEPNRKRRAHALPPDWKPDDELLDWARQSFPKLDIDYECDTFTDYWIGCGKPKLDWRATWRNWMRRSAKSSPPSGGFRRAHGSVDENRRRIDAALARRPAHDEGSRGEAPRLRLIDGGHRSS